MTTEEIKQYVRDFFKLENDSELEYFLRWESETVYEGERDQHRWIIYFEKVVKIGDKFFSFMDATCTGDNSLEDCGYEFEWDEVYEVEPKEVKTITYVRKD